MRLGISLPISYTYYYGFVGEYRAVPHFEVGINYNLPKTKYVTIGLSHTSGRDLDTFEKVRIYKFSLGLKY